MTALCPRCRHVLDVYPDEEHCPECGYVNRRDFYGDVEEAAAERPLRDDDEGWGESASSFARDLDEMAMRFPE